MEIRKIIPSSLLKGIHPWSWTWFTWDFQPLEKHVSKFETIIFSFQPLVFLGRVYKMFITFTLSFTKKNQPFSVFWGSIWYILPWRVLQKNSILKALKKTTTNDPTLTEETRGFPAGVFWVTFFFHSIYVWYMYLNIFTITNYITKCRCIYLTWMLRVWEASFKTDSVLAKNPAFQTSKNWRLLQRWKPKELLQRDGWLGRNSRR